MHPAPQGRQPEPCGTQCAEGAHSCGAAGSACQQHPQAGVSAPLQGASWAERQQGQYLRDLAVLERCELAIEERAGCPSFFLCLGAAAAVRGGHGS
jgi:hypothetical protein